MVLTPYNVHLYSLNEVGETPLRWKFTVLSQSIIPSLDILSRNYANSDGTYTYYSFSYSHIFSFYRQLGTILTHSLVLTRIVSSPQ